MIRGEFATKLDLQSEIRNVLLFKLCSAKYAFVFSAIAEQNYTKARFAEGQKFVFLPKSVWFVKKIQYYIVLWAATTSKELRAMLKPYDGFCDRLRRFKIIGFSNNTQYVRACQ